MMIAADKECVVIHPKWRGVTLIEAVLYISVALALIVGGVVFYQQASAAQKTSAAIRQFSAIVAETRTLYVNNPFQSVLTGITPPAGSAIGTALIAAGAVPEQYAKAGSLDGAPTSLINPWGGATEVYGTTIGSDPYLVMVTGDVPVSACPRLIASNVNPVSPNSTTAVTAIADGSRQIGVWDMDTGTMTFTARNYTLNQAAAMCKVGSQAYLLAHDAAGTYTGPPVPQPRAVGMWMAFQLY